ncbi:MAG: fumarate hydratase [Thiothrix sp.]
MGAGWCPPGCSALVSVAQPEKAAVLAKEVLMEPIDIQELIARGPQNRVEELRIELQVNQLGIGAQGLGDLTTVRRCENQDALPTLLRCRCA